MGVVVVGASLAARDKFQARFFKANSCFNLSVIRLNRTKRSTEDRSLKKAHTIRCDADGCDLSFTHADVYQAMTKETSSPNKKEMERPRSYRTNLRLMSAPSKDSGSSILKQSLFFNPLRNTTSIES